jgi:hypothetical protein
MHTCELPDILNSCGAQAHTHKFRSQKCLLMYMPRITIHMCAYTSMVIHAMHTPRNSRYVSRDPGYAKIAYHVAHEHAKDDGICRYMHCDRSHESIYKHNQEAYAYIYLAGIQTTTSRYCMFTSSRKTIGTQLSSCLWKRLGEVRSCEQRSPPHGEIRHWH